MSDLIYRHDAIKSIETSRFLVDAIEKVMMLPTAQPKTGKWINGHWDGDSNFRIDGRGDCWFVRECSNCHEEIKGKPTKYCPNCGCRMKEGD